MNNCLVCGKEMPTDPYLGKRHPKLYCEIQCRTLANHIRQTFYGLRWLNIAPTMAAIEEIYQKTVDNPNSGWTTDR